MNNPTIKLTKRDAFESIWFDSQYPSLNTIDHTTNWIISQDVQAEQSLMCLELEEQFVECVEKSEKMPFKFDKSMAGTTLNDKKPSNPGRLFYALLSMQHGNTINSTSISPAIFRIRNYDGNQNKYEESEYSKILHKVASKLNLNHAYFSYNPMTRIGAHGLLEGELVNSLFTHLQVAIKRPGFQTKMDARKKESNQNFTNTKRYFARLRKNSPCLYGVRMTLCYWGNETKQISLKESDDHLKAFSETFNTPTSQNSPVGWWCKREYTTEAGYRYNLIIFFDGQKMSYNPMLSHDTYGPHWHSVTKGRGAYFIPPVPEKDCMSLKAGLLHQGIDDNVESLLLTMQCMLMRDNILRLKRSAGYSHIGMGKMPKLANVTIPTRCAVPKSFSYVTQPA